MKKLRKLQNISEKLMKNEELVSLRGGYGYNCCICYDGMTPTEYMASWNYADCVYSITVNTWVGLVLRDLEEWGIASIIFIISYYSLFK